MFAAAMLIAAGVGILAWKGAFARDAGEFNRRHYSGTRRLWHDRELRRQLVFGQVVGIAAIVVGAVWLTVALL